VPTAASPYAKPALSYADQALLLKQRGLVIGDDALAASLLARVSYYRLSAYWFPFRRRNANGCLLSAVGPGTHLESVMELYEFDRKLRILVMDALERVEVSIRTAVTYRIGMAYGAFGHESPANFHPKFDHGGWIRKLRDETLRSSDAFVSHFAGRYEEFPALPIWMTTELISLGTLSRLFKGMQPGDKRAVAQPMNLHHRRLQDWLHVLTYVRNVCAHHSRLWNRELAIRPAAMPEPHWNSPLLPRQDRVFCVLLMLRHLLRQFGNGDAWRDQCNALLRPVAANPQLRVVMGMGHDWIDHPHWV
jgi:abortive infection bacteriophage resistance protein